MADNTRLNTGTGGDVIATDDIGGVKFQRIKLIQGADGVNDGDISDSNPFPVMMESPRSITGEMLSSERTPIIQARWVNNIDTNEIISIQHETATVTTVAAELTVATGETASSFGQMKTKNHAPYRPGQGIDIRLSARFTAGIAATEQLVGLGDAENGLFFGYNGANFGILKRTGGQVEIRTLTISAGAGTGSGNITITINGSAVVVAVTENDTIGVIATKIANTDFNDVSGGWRAVYAGNRIEFIAITTEARGGSYSFADTDTTGVAASFSQTAAAIAATDTWINQSSWNNDPADGTAILPVIDFTKGNVFKINYQWLGYGHADFYIDHPTRSRSILVHRIQNSNNAVATYLRQTDLPLSVIADNKATTNNLIVRSGSMGVFLNGRRINFLPRYTFSHLKSIGTDETVIFSLRIKSIFGGVSSRTSVFIDGLSMGNNGNKTATFRLYKNPGLVGAPSWTEIDNVNSVVETSTASTAINGAGNKIYTTIVGSASGLVRDLRDPQQILLHPGDLLVVTGQMSSGASNDLEVSLTWAEAA